MRNHCHTPIFDLRHHEHVSVGPDFSNEILAERYFKIPHFRFRVGPSSLFILFLFFIFNSIFLISFNFNFLLL